MMSIVNKCPEFYFLCKYISFKMRGISLTFRYAGIFMFSLCCVSMNLLTVESESNDIAFMPNSLKLQVNDVCNISLSFSRPLQYPTKIVFTYLYGGKQVVFNQSHDVVLPLSSISIKNGTNETQVPLEGVNPGTVMIGVNTTSPEFVNGSDAFVKVTVLRSNILDVFNIVIGWIYFAAWSISFYPQIVHNWKRKSVVGLNFDFLAYNITGHFSYCMYNIALYWIPVIQTQYFTVHPRGVNPVQLNDVFFSLHAVVMCAVTILQCIIYESGKQSISRLGVFILCLMWSFLIISLFIAVGHVINWLMFINFLSYVKLAITLIKYVPQAVMNYRRKSTIGWSIGNVLLDFTGGSLSILQSIFIAYNADDWGSVSGNVTKFGLGLFSILFDILFIVQHYCLYRHRRGYEVVNGDVTD